MKWRDPQGVDRDKHFCAPNYGESPSPILLLTMVDGDDATLL